LAAPGGRVIVGSATARPGRSGPLSANGARDQEVEQDRQQVLNDRRQRLTAVWSGATSVA
jgi:hypothetical protein